MKQQRRRLRRLMLLLCMGLCVSLLACTGEKVPKDKVADLEFTVVPEREIPEELQKLIRDKQKNPFKLSYSADGCLYIVVGFGQKDTGGYSVRVNELYLTENAVIIDTDLLGPAQNEEVSQAPSYPYVVICTEDRPESVVFR